MTESEAIELIEKDLKLHSKDLSSKYKKGLTMAINALEKQEKIKEALEKWRTESGGYIYADDDATELICTLSQILRSDEAIEIVKQGGVSDDVCEWKLEDEEANLYLTGCQQRQLIFEGTPKENGYRYCPYCGKKIKIVGD